MAIFPEDEHIRDAIAQAFINPVDPNHGYVRFEARGTIHTYRLPLTDFARLARDIQSAMRRSDLPGPPPSPASDQ
jgi:hypothetical protein